MKRAVASETPSGTSALVSLYRCDNVQLEGRCVYTNSPIAGAFRGYGVVQTYFALDTQMDEAAERLGLDPAALKLHNAVRQRRSQWPRGGAQTVAKDARIALLQRERHRCLAVCGERQQEANRFAAHVAHGVPRQRPHVDVRRRCADLGEHREQMRLHSGTLPRDAARDARHRRDSKAREQCDTALVVPEAGVA